MAETMLNVPDISCGHCERTVTGALTPLGGVRDVKVDIAAKQVHVTYDELAIDVERMKVVLAEEDYPVESVQPVRRSSKIEEYPRESGAEVEHLPWKSGEPSRAHLGSTLEVREFIAMTTTITAIDPVCGMSVNPETARRTSEYQGQTYYFCSPACKKMFDADSLRYLDNPGSSELGCSCCSSA